MKLEFRYSLLRRSLYRSFFSRAQARCLSAASLEFGAAPLARVVVETDAGFATVGEKLHDVMHLLDEVRAALDEAKEAMEDDAKDAAGFTVARV